MRILLIGANGQLAQDLLRFLTPDEVVPVTHQQLEICDARAVQALFDSVRPNCVINTAAFHLVDDCEEQVEKAFAVNAAGVNYLARAAQGAGAVFVHFSTDYVFDGLKQRPYIETDLPWPLSIYGMSKLAGEWGVQRYCEKYFLIRTCGLYGPGGARRERRKGNFVQTMLRLAQEGNLIRVVSDQVSTPTSTRDLAEKLSALIRTENYGLYHMTNLGECSWYEFAREIFRQTRIAPQLSPTTSETFGAKAPRPPYSVLDNAALRKAGFPDFRPWQEALAEYLHEHQRQNL